MQRRIALWIVAGVLLCLLAWRTGRAAESLTITEITYGAGYDLIRWDWISNPSGASSGDTIDATYTGRLIWVVQMPDAGGTQPTNAYDVTILDENGVDVLNGLGANISNLANSTKTESEKLGAMVSSPLHYVVQNAGDSNGGSTIIVIGK
jgi:hypothetical protein